MSTPQVKIGITHNDILGLLCLTMLIYDYGKKFVIDESETLEQFMSSIDESKLDETEIEALETICERTSEGKVITFLNDKVTDLQAGITLSEKRKKIYVVFRGSESVYDWLYDLQVGKVELGDGVEVHKGFYKQLFDNGAFSILRDEILLLLADEKYKDYDVYVSGHSLGAALSSLFSYLLSMEISNKIISVAFASPRVGNDELVKSINSRKNLSHYRVNTQFDIVTVFPYYGYYHAGINIRLCEDDVEIYDNKPSKEYNIFDCHSVSDHYCESYYKKLKKLKW